MLRMRVRVMSRFEQALFLFLVLGIGVSSARSQGTSTGTTSEDFNNEGSSGATFQKIGVGARAAGMGGAYSAMADDVTALYWNPAGAARLQGINVAASY